MLLSVVGRLTGSANLAYASRFVRWLVKFSPKNLHQVAATRVQVIHYSPISAS